MECPECHAENTFTYEATVTITRPMEYHDGTVYLSRDHDIISEDRDGQAVCIHCKYVAETELEPE